MFTPLSCAQALHEMLRHSNRFIISAYTGAPELLAFSKTAVTVRPIGLMFKMYRQHFGTIPLAVAGNSPQHEVKGTVGVDKPRVSSGSDTYPLDAVAALATDRKSLALAIVNPTESAQQIDVAFQGVTVQGKGRLWRIAGGGPDRRECARKAARGGHRGECFNRGARQTSGSSDQHQHLRVPPPAATRKPSGPRRDFG